MTPLGDERRTRPSVGLRVIGGVAMLAGLLAGIVLLGRLADTDVVAMLLTTVFFGVVLVGILLIVRRQRDWLLPLAVPFVVVVLGAGFVLGRPLVTDDVVDEVVVTADEPAPSAPSPSTTRSTTPSAPEPTAATSPRAATNVKIASGRFEAIAHPGSGTATLIRTASGEVKLTFTSFSTDNGPDVRVYLSRDTKASGRGSSFVELGALKGNKGNQQYAVPADVDLTSIDSIVLWCRAFDVGFIQAPLTQV